MSDQPNSNSTNRLVTWEKPLSQASLQSQTLHRLFHTFSAADYTILWLLYNHSQDTGEEKLYLKDIAQRLDLPVSQVSKLVQALRNKGLVLWTHDGTGEEGTYIQLTPEALLSTMAQKNKLERVIQAYGEEDFVHLLGQLARLDEIIRQEEDTHELDLPAGP